MDKDNKNFLDKSEKRRLEEMVRQGIKPDEIAYQLDKYPRVVKSYLNSASYNPHRKMRKCLICGNEFLSDHKGNRICKSAHQRELAGL